MPSVVGLGRWTGAAILVALSVACSNTSEGLKKDAEENKREAAQMSEEAKAKADSMADKTIDKTENTADKIGDATKNAADKVGDATESAARAAGDAVATAGRATEAAVQTLDVKAALIADKRVDAGGIDVDTYGATKTVVLRGHVPTQAQKKIAGEIAVGKAGGYEVKNELIVRP